MRFVSTRAPASAPQTQSLSFSDAVLAGLATDGGLYVPERIPMLPPDWRSWAKLPFHSLAARLLALYIDDADVPLADLELLTAASFATFDCPEVTPLRPISGASLPNANGGAAHPPALMILELWHGPTFAFKDVALQFLGNLFEYLLNRTGKRITVVGATSGDTGSAAIYGLRGKRNVNVCILHPRGKISPVQEAQMTTVLDANVCNIAISGTFDDCQDVVKHMFSDQALRDEFHLAAVNSINIARILAQVTYYFAAYFQYTAAGTGGDGKVSFSVPSGNFGDVLAGYYAQQMGLPVEQLIVATNNNDILDRFLKSGVYETRPATTTLSPAMDISVASNFERALHMWCGDGAQIVEWMRQLKADGKFTVSPAILQKARHAFASASVSDDQIADAIRRYYAAHQYLLDPHTAVGVVAAERLRPDAVTVCLSTAHPGKFGDAVKAAVPHLTDADILPPQFHGLLEKPRSLVNIDAPTAERVAEVLRCQFATLQTTFLC
ncbi:threonine synthase [Sorochytrium milnesiophthora]